MPSYKSKNGTRFAYDEQLENQIVILRPEANADPDSDDPAQIQVMGKVDPSDLLEFAEFLFDKARYESVARLRISAGDVLLVRTGHLTESAMTQVENQVRQDILAPLGLTEKVTVVALDGALDLEVISREG